MSGHKKYRECCVCFVAGIYQWGRCVACGRGMSSELLARLRRLTRAERELEYQKTAHHDRPHFEWQGDEQASIDADEKRTGEKQ